MGACTGCKVVPSINHSATITSVTNHNNRISSTQLQANIFLSSGALGKGQIIETGKLNKDIFRIFKKFLRCLIG